MGSPLDELEDAPAPAPAQAQASPLDELEDAAPEPSLPSDSYPVGRQQVGAGESALRGGAKGLSFGLSDKMAGMGARYAGESAPRATGRGIHAPVMSEAEHGAQVGEDLHQDWKQRDEQAAEDHPVLYRGSELAGIAASSLPLAGAAPEIRAVTEADKLAALYRTGAGIATEGALSGYGYSEDPSTTGKLKDAATGAGTALATAGAMQAGGQALARRAAGLRRFADNNRLGQANIPVKAAEAYPGGKAALVASLRRQKIVGGLAGPGQIASRAEDAVARSELVRDAAAEQAAQSGKTIPGGPLADQILARSRKFGGEDFADQERAAAQQAWQDEIANHEATVRALQEHEANVAATPAPSRPSPAPRGKSTNPGRVRVKPAALADTDPAATPVMDPSQAALIAKRRERLQALQEAGRNKIAAMRAEGPRKIPESPTGAGARKLMEDEAEAVRPREMSFSALNAKRKEWGSGRKAKFGSAGETPERAEAFQALHGLSNDALEQHLDQLSPDLGGRWREAGKEEAAAVLARDSANAAQHGLDRRLGLPEYAAGAAGLMKGGVDAAAMGMAAARGIRARGNAVMATGAEAMQGGISKLVDTPNTRIGRILQASISRGMTKDTAARAHFLRSALDPNYNESVYESR